MYGRLNGSETPFTIESRCVHSGAPIRIELDSGMTVTGMTEGCEPMVSIPMVNTARLKEPGIVDVF